MSPFPLTGQIFTFPPKKYSLSVLWCLPGVVFCIIISMQHGLGAIASSMRSCHSPEDFCRTKTQCVKNFHMFMATSTHLHTVCTMLLSVKRRKHSYTSSLRLCIQTFAAWYPPLPSKWLAMVHVQGCCKSWTLDYGLVYGLDHGLDHVMSHVIG